jgi:hypothetical protein
VNRYPATPREFEALMEQLEHVPQERRPSIARLVFEEIATCPRCEEAVRSCDPRRLVGDQLHHLDCVSDAGGAAPAGGMEGEEVSGG